MWSIKGQRIILGTFLGKSKGCFNYFETKAVSGLYVLSFRANHFTKIGMI